MLYPFLGWHFLRWKMAEIEIEGAAGSR